MDEKRRRKLMRSDIGSYGWALLIYYILMTACVAVAMMLQMAGQLFLQMTRGDFSDVPDMDPDALMGNGWGYLIACVLAVLLIRVWKGKSFFGGMWKSERVMTPGAFFQITCVFLSGQLVFQICATIQETVLNFFGLSVLEAMEQATVGSDTVSMFLYLSLGAPIVEEIIFRGLVLRGLERYGKRFAILISALLFGLFHGNIVQSPYAFLVGLVLGYVAMEYSIFWAMVLHMINNLVLGDTLPRLTQGLGEDLSLAVTQGVILACSAVALVSLIRNRKQILAYHRADKPEWSCLGAFATAPGILVLIALMEFSAISMLFL